MYIHTHSTSLVESSGFRLNQSVLALNELRRERESESLSGYIMGSSKAALLVQSGGFILQFAYAEAMVTWHNTTRHWTHDCCAHEISFIS